MWLNIWVYFPFGEQKWKFFFEAFWFVLDFLVCAAVEGAQSSSQERYRITITTSLWKEMNTPTFRFVTLLWSGGVHHHFLSQFVFPFSSLFFNSASPTSFLQIFFHPIDNPSFRALPWHGFSNYCWIFRHPCYIFLPFLLYSTFQFLLVKNAPAIYAV